MHYMNIISGKIMNGYLTKSPIELQNKLHLLENLFHGSVEAMAALDRNMSFTMKNKAFIQSFSKIFGIRVRVQMNFLHVLADFPDLRERIVSAYQTALNGQKNQITIENDTLKEEAYYCYEAYFVPLTNTLKDKILGVILNIKNISEYKINQRRRLEQHAILAQAAKKNAIVEMANALAHEINQPLSAINIYSYACLEILKNNPQIEERNLHALSQIVELTQHAGNIVHRMKSFMREGEICLEQADINVLIKHALTFLEHVKKDLKFIVELNLTEILPLIYLDKVKITQVIINLAQNSIEAFQGKDRSLLKISIETVLNDKHIEVNFKDNGPGISADVFNKILNSYFSTKASTGLGLHICRNLIQAHGGKLVIHESTTGAHLCFTLPIKKLSKKFKARIKYE